jgi:hypothetical protein
MKLLPVYKYDVIACYSKVDDDIFDELMKFTWRLGTNGYVIRSKRKEDFINEQYKPGRQLELHRVVNKTPLGFQTDHVDGDKLNNQKENLRTCDKKQNQGNKGLWSSNKSGFKGVSYIKTTNCKKHWYACINIGGKTKNLGLYLTKEEAALAYNKAALEHFGEFAYLNEI